MVHYSKVAQAVAAYIDREVLPKMAGKWQGWIIGGATGIALKKINEGFPHIANNPVVKMLGVVDGENIDVETVIAALMEQARKGPVSVNLPAGISLTLTADDVVALHRHIMA